MLRSSAQTHPSSLQDPIRSVTILHFEILWSRKTILGPHLYSQSAASASCLPAFSALVADRSCSSQSEIEKAISNKVL